MIGKIIQTEDNTYTIVEPISTGRENADIYLCTDAAGNKYAAKYFYNQPPRANNGINVYNHFGRRRDGSEDVFYEIQEKNMQFGFLLKHIERVSIDNKWLIILEYAPGITLNEFIYAFYANNIKKVECAIIKFAEMLTLWHSYGFAHGDPHLDNVMVHEIGTNDCTIMFIDYCLIHHKDFYWCQEYRCFTFDPYLRIKEDLQNDDGRLGAGFRTGLIEIQEELNLDTRFSDLFDLHYRYIHHNP